jgi:heme-degrading monooxygenase HmoA
MMYLAQLNIAQMKGENMEDPIMARFAEQLDDVNALAEGSDGFIWRLKDETGNATDIQAFDDPKMIVNMSVWESLEKLEAFVFSGHHLEVMKNRREWFHKMATMHMVLWWIPVGHTPTVEEAKERLDYLQQNGATKQAFTFRQKFDWQ